MTVAERGRQTTYPGRLHFSISLQPEDRAGPRGGIQQCDVRTREREAALGISQVLNSGREEDELALRSMAFLSS
jgi:hypothetical protein